MQQNWEILGIGNALVDVLAKVEDGFLNRHNLRKGAMTLMSQAEAEKLYAAIDNPAQVSGGSVANSMAGIAAMGGKAAFIGKLAGDGLGHVFRNDMAETGVHFETAPTQSGALTGRSLILVTPDGQRTMNTYLGAALELAKEDFAPKLLAHGKIVFIEGYLYDTAHLRPHLELAAGLAHAAGNRVAMTLCDAWLVDRHREDMRRFVHDHVDILFANESEITSFYQTGDIDAAISSIRKDCHLAAITRSEQGSVIVTDKEVIEIKAFPAEVIDTTGAGDQYAAGVLFGLSRNYPLPLCGELGSILASEVISHIGARPGKDIVSYVQSRAALPSFGG